MRRRLVRDSKQPIAAVITSEPWDSYVREFDASDDDDGGEYGGILLLRCLILYGHELSRDLGNRQQAFMNELHAPLKLLQC